MRVDFNVRSVSFWDSYWAAPRQEPGLRVVSSCQVAFIDPGSRCPVALIDPGSRCPVALIDPGVRCQVALIDPGIRCPVA